MLNAITNGTEQNHIASERIAGLIKAQLTVAYLVHQLTTGGS